MGQQVIQQGVATLGKEHVQQIDVADPRIARRQPDAGDITQTGIVIRGIFRPLPHNVFDLPENPLADRSEEHTSELQSLMRISYAVFCLKKKKKNKAILKTKGYVQLS